MSQNLHVWRCNPIGNLSPLLLLMAVLLGSRQQWVSRQQPQGLRLDFQQRLQAGTCAAGSPVRALGPPSPYPGSEAPGEVVGGLAARIAMGDPTHAVRPWPWCCRHSRAPHGQLATRSCVRQERSPARPFLRFPGKACLWEGRKLAAGSVWDTNTWKPFLCQRFDAWGGQSSPALGGLAPRCVGLRAGLKDSPQRAMPGTWPQNGARRGTLALSPRLPASPCAGRRLRRGRKCRALTPRFHRGDGWPSSVLRGSILLQAAALAPGCSPARRGGRGHAGCPPAPARPPAGGAVPIGTPAMLFYQFSPSAVRGKLGTRLCSWLPFPPLSSLGGDTGAVPPWGRWGVWMSWGNSGLEGWCFCSWLGAP